MKKLLLLAGLLAVTSSPAFSQTVTFSPQGSAILKNQTGQRIPGVQIIDVLACSQSAATIPNGFVYQTAVANGFSIIGPSMGAALVNQNIAKDWKHFLIQVLTDGALDVAIGGLTGVVSIPTGAIKGLAIAHGFMDKFSPQLLATAPTPAAFTALLLDPSKFTQFTAPGCVEGAMLAQYSKGSHAVGPVLISASAIQASGPVVKDSMTTVKDDASEAAYAWMTESDLQTERLRKIMKMHEENARDWERFNELENTLAVR